jgi:hypothetical protein
MTVTPTNTKPFTVEEVVLMNRLRRLGKPQPSFATQREIREWLERNRHLVEDGK